MLDINHIISVISHEFNTFGVESYLMNGFSVWVAYKITGSLSRVGFRIFWLVYSLLHLFQILQSNSILYNPFFAFAISVFFLQVDVLKYTHNAIDYFKQRALNKYQSCVDRNAFIEREEDKVKRENKNSDTEALKQKQENRFLENLSNKLDFK